MAPDKFFLERYRWKAAESDPIAQAGRGREFQPVEFLHAVRESIALLQPQPAHDTLDIGCANGMIDIILSALCRSLLGVEPVSELVDLARQNLEECINTEIKQGHAADIPAEDNSFDRVLMMEALQLAPKDETSAIFGEIYRVSRPGSRIVIGSIPDLRHRERFLTPYLDSVRSATHLTDEAKAEIVEANQRGSWYDPGDLIRRWHALGCHAEARPPAPSHPNADHRFHLVITVDGHA